MSKTFLLKNTLTKLSTKNVAEFNLQNCPNFPSFRVRTWCGVWWYYWCGVVLWSGTMRWSVVMWCMVVVWCGMMWCMVAVWCGMMWCMVAVSYDVEMICWNMICYDLIWRGMIWYLMWCGMVLWVCVWWCDLVWNDGVMYAHGWWCTVQPFFLSMHRWWKAFF